MTLDDLELYRFEFSENFAGFRRQQTWTNEDRAVSDNVVNTSNCSNFWHALTSRGFVSDSWAFLYFRRPNIPETQHWDIFAVLTNMLMRLKQFQCFIPVLFHHVRRALLR